MQLVHNEHYGMIWRAEVQERGALHWHCVMAIRLEGMATADDGRDWIRGNWALTINRVFPAVEYPKPVRIQVGAGWYDCIQAVSGPLAEWPGATSCRRRGCFCGGQGHMVQIEHSERGRDAWYRYMADHASKGKKEQIGENIGRHWGVVGRKHFPQMPGRFVEMTEKGYARFRRAQERLATPRIPDDRAPFGMRLGFRCKRGRVGTAVSFTKPVTLEQLLTLAIDGSDYKQVRVKSKCQQSAKGELSVVQAKSNRSKTLATGELKTGVA
jgi:hypothetical protein